MLPVNDAQIRRSYKFEDDNVILYTSKELALDSDFTQFLIQEYDKISSGIFIYWFANISVIMANSLFSKFKKIRLTNGMNIV